MVKKAVSGPESDTRHEGGSVCEPASVKVYQVVRKDGKECNRRRK